ncbi:MAG: hypothetical protein MJZ68_05255 [archaeon]|nr:hypothetical protein [archaeon]
MDKDFLSQITEVANSVGKTVGRTAKKAGSMAKDALGQTATKVKAYNDARQQKKAEEYAARMAESEEVPEAFDRRSVPDEPVDVPVPETLREETEVEKPRVEPVKLVDRKARHRTIGGFGSKEDYYDEPDDAVFCMQLVKRLEYDLREVLEHSPDERIDLFALMREAELRGAFESRLVKDALHELRTVRNAYIHDEGKPISKTSRQFWVVAVFSLEDYEY